MAKSAGSNPAGEVHPLSLQYLQEAGYDTTGLQSQSWDALQSYGPDVVITVCDRAAQEPCPVWFGDSLQIHWGLADPSSVTGSDEDKATAFRRTIAEIERRTGALVDLPLADLDQHTLANHLAKIASASDRTQRA